jgi:hypothetical protein
MLVYLSFWWGVLDTRYTKFKELLRLKVIVLMLNELYGRSITLKIESDFHDKLFVIIIRNCCWGSQARQFAGAPK